MKTLRMEFKTNEDKNFVVNVAPVKDGLTAAAVTTAMQAIIAADPYVTAIVGIEAADVIDRTETPIVGA